MKHQNIVTNLFESETDGASLMKAYLRASAQYALAEVLEEEVSHLCGPKYESNNIRPFRRAGSEKGFLYAGGKKQSIKRPRVRVQTAKGEREHGLLSYHFAQQISNIEDEIIRSVEAGVSTRKHSHINGDEALSKSSISRIWASKGAERLEELRSRQIDHDNWVALMLDGFVLSEDVTAIVALGFNDSGEKVILDFIIGSSENLVLTDELISNIVNRGFQTKGRLLCVTDGSKALRKSVMRNFSGAVLQRCLIHKERNLHGYLSKRDHVECSRLMTRLRKAEGLNAANLAIEDLKGFLKKKNKAAYESLLEAGEELTALHSLNVPATLNKTFLSTNAIENVMRNLRRQLGRVNRWRSETGQPDLWVASGLLVAETGFRRISSYKDIPFLCEALTLSTSNKKATRGIPSVSPPSASAKRMGVTDADGGEAPGIQRDTSRVEYQNKDLL